MKIKSILFFMIVFCAEISLAQESNCNDSIKYYSEKNIEDTLKINIFNDKSTAIRSTDPDCAIALAKTALLFATKNNQFTKQAISLKNIGSGFFFKSNFDEALSYYQNSLYIYLALNDEKGSAALYSNIGLIYKNKGEYLKSLSYYHQSMKIREKSSDDIGLSAIYNNIGGLYYTQKNYNSALIYFNKALEKYKQINNTKGLLETLSNIGLTYTNLKKYNEAWNAYETLLSLSKQLKKPLNGDVYNNIGLFFDIQDKFSKAKEFFSKAIIEYRKTSNTKGIALSNANLAQLEVKLFNYAAAEMHFQQAFSIAKENNFLEVIKITLDYYAEYNAKLNNFKKAYESLVEFVKLNDSLMSKEIMQQFAEMQAKNENEIKEQKIQLLTKEKELNQFKIKNQELKLSKSRLFTYVLISGLALLIIFFIILFRNFKIKQRLNKELQIKNQEIEQHQEEILTQRDNLSELNHELLQRQEEITIQKDIIERKNENILSSIRYAKQIQQAILPAIDKVSDCFKDFFIIYQPKDIVSGDFYWVNKIDNYSIIAIVDCTGHGVPGAFMSMIGNTILNQVIIEQKILNPAEVLKILNQEVVDALHQNTGVNDNVDGMDIALCIFNENTRQLQFAAAKRQLLYIKNNELVEIKGDLQSIGGFQRSIEKEYTLHSIDNITDEKFYLFTDGYTDQMNKQGKKLGTKNLKQSLVNISNKSIKEQHVDLMNIMEMYQLDNEQIDDITIIGFVF